MTARPRTPVPPAEVVAWVAEFGGCSPEASGEALREGALRALRAALERPGRSREGAHALLAADGLLTWAVEDAAEEDDPAASLRILLAAVLATLEEPRGHGGERA